MKNKDIKIALIGNLNNNHFTMMRYLRDLGYDAYLLLYIEDGQGANSHFVPENDTWDIDKWSNYIVQTKLNNGSFRAFKHLFFSNYVKVLFNSYDIIIGNGFAPAYSYFAKKRLNMFMPYMVGVEFLNLTKSNNIFQSFKYYIYRKVQTLGIKYFTDCVATYDTSEENNSFLKKIDVHILNLPIPMIYSDSKPVDINLNKLKINRFIEEIKTCDLSVFSHMAHIWKNIPNNFCDVKKNNILIEGFAKYVKTKKSNNYTAKLFLVDYGPDVLYSKDLIKKLHIEAYVTWLPKMSRKEIILLLENVSLGCSELGGLLWGGIGWEFLSKGVPFFHYLEISKNNFPNSPNPSFLNVKTIDEIANHLHNYEINPDKYKKIGESSNEWFNKYNGVGLVEKYMCYLNNSIRD